jgi:hypothetical protein
MRQFLRVMKYRLDSVRKNKTRLKRKFLASPPKKKAPVSRRKNQTWLLPAIIVVLILLNAVVMFFAHRSAPQEKTIIKETIRETIKEVPQVPVIKEEPIRKPKPKVMKKDTSNCYQARRNGVYYTDCNWK